MFIPLYIVFQINTNSVINLKDSYFIPKTERIDSATRETRTN